VPFGVAKSIDSRSFGRSRVYKGFWLLLEKADGLTRGAKK